VAALLLLIIIPITNAAPAAQLVSQFNLTSDRTATPVTYTFFTEPASGTLKFHELFSPNGIEAYITILVNSKEGPVEVQLRFDRQFVTVYFPQSGTIILQIDRKTLDCCSLYSFAIKDGQLTVAIGNKTNTIDNISAFTGSFVSQSVSGKAAVYK
jgi:hypothetical protein